MTSPKAGPTRDETPSKFRVRARGRRPTARAIRLALQAGLPLLMLLGAYKGFLYLKATKPEPPRRAAAEQTFSIETTPVLFSRYQPDLTLYGETVAGRVVDIRALVSGKVIETGDGLRDGGIVKAGDTLVVIDRFDYRGALIQAKAFLAEARAKLREYRATHAQEIDALRRDREQLEIARRDLARAEPLARRGTVSKKAVDDRRLVVNQRIQTVEQRQSSLTIWEARIKQQEAALTRLKWGVRQAERRLSETRLTAPFDAYVSDVGAQVGRVLSANDRVATLRDRGSIEARFNLSDLQYGRIESAGGSLIGRTAEVIWRVGDEPVVFTARVARIAAEIASDTGGVTVFARLEDPLQPMAIRPGAFVEVKLADRVFDKVARLPATAIYSGNIVYAVVEGRLRPRKVDVIGRAGADALVRGAIQAGEAIMVTRLSAPGPGVKVSHLASPKISLRRLSARDRDASGSDTSSEPTARDGQ